MKFLKSRQAQNILDNLFLVILLLYPMRHVHIGIDLWDTGYNYANFVYMGTRHMDSMWLFSTYLANALGHLFTMLPGGQSLVGLNIYTGLLVSVLAGMGYFFATRALQMEKWVAFFGEIAALSLCWCPTAKLYDYLSYVLFTACVILLYKGLTKGKMVLLAVAGVCLGMNIFVRFSNLPQMVLIVAVWVYAALEERENKRNTSVRAILHGGFMRGLGYTEWCVGGYLTAVIVMFAYLHVRYGLDNYFNGIRRLLGMTDNATDYKASSMVLSIVKTYLVNTYWMNRLALIALVGMVVWGLIQTVMEHWTFLKEREKLCKVVQAVLCAGWGIISLGTIWWLWSRDFFSFLYYSYDSMLLPGILFLMLTMVIAVIRILHRRSSKEERLLGGLMILVVLVTSIGSNNNVYPSLNNLFLVAPCTLWWCLRFVRDVKACRLGKWQLVCDPAAAKGVLLAFLGLFMVQSVLFGSVFVFAEGTGVQNPTAKVTGNPVLQGVVMNSERARWMQEISDYVEENELQGREVVLYGKIPAMSFYLQMPAAFNPWPDLASYNLETMQDDMELLRKEIEKEEVERPIVIAENIYGQYTEGNKLALVRMGLDEDYIQVIMDDPKWRMITDFMRDFDYELTFQNDKFMVWQ
ncbi:MAG: hypothetical protein IJ833_08550 [Lachnospiraceae bacterium]|nr:hypothetical protein [Lachnospiraceae bacterium]